MAIRIVAVFALVLALVGGVYVSMGKVGKSTEATPTNNQQSATDDASAQAAHSTAEREAKTKADAASRSLASRARAGQGTVVAASPSPSPSASPSPGKPSTPIGPIPASCEEYTGNVKIGCAVMLQSGYGFGMDQMPCLKNIWMKESGWNEKATNRSSGAYGIPQSLPPDKMAEFGADWRTNPATQVKWGLKYIKGRYKTPCGSWAFFQANGWY